MNIRRLSENVGEVFRLRPNPMVTKTKKCIKESVNTWTLLTFTEQKALVLQHNHSTYRIEVPAVYVRGHEPPDMIVLRGQVRLEDDGKYSFEPFTEGMSADDPAELVEDPMNRYSNQLYVTLKPHEGKVVSIRFPTGSDGALYGPTQATLLEVTPNFVKLLEEEVRIGLGIFLDNSPLEIKSPESRRTIGLSFLQYEEDDANGNRPRLVVDHSHWEAAR